MKTNVIDRFDGNNRWLSNFVHSPVLLDGMKFPTVEHAYQAAKTKDLYERSEILHVSSPGKAKRLGRRVTIRKDWDTFKLEVMEYLIRQKFNIPSFKRLLLSTGNAALIEGNNWHDTYWGVCNDSGHNHLGKIIMKVREELK